MIFRDKTEEINSIYLEIISGKWGNFGWPRDEALEFVETYISGFNFSNRNEEIEDGSVDHFHYHQRLLMSRKPVADFYKIQQYPPFSTQTLRNFISLLSAFRTSGRSAISIMFDRLFPFNFEYSPPDEPIAILYENSGDTIENAVEIRITGPNSGVKLLPRWKLGIFAEYWYLCFNYGMRGEDWNLDMHRSSFEGNRTYSHYNLTHEDGRNIEIYFDNTDYKGNGLYER